MECTNDVDYINKIQNKRKSIKHKDKKRTSSILRIINNHKFITSIVAMFISFSILNVILIVNFITILEKNIYI